MRMENYDELEARALQLPMVRMKAPVGRAQPRLLMQAAMQFIERHPERHKQNTWMDEEEVPRGTADDEVPICGTAGCLAGWGIALNNPIEGTRIVTGPGMVVLEDNQTAVIIDEYAAYLFGITLDQARVLFDGHWSVRALRAGVDAITGDPSISGAALRYVMDSARI